MDLTITSTIISFSIVFSALLIGLGKAISSKKLEQFGFEELIQAIVNSALVGSFAAAIIVLSSISSDSVDSSLPCSQQELINTTVCIYENFSTESLSLIQKETRLSEIVGYYSTASVNFPSFSITPLSGISSNLHSLDLEYSKTSASLSLFSLILSILRDLDSTLLSVVLPLGVIFRSFYPTRKLGGYLLAFSISMYLAFPFFLSLFSTSNHLETKYLDDFLDTAQYSIVSLTEISSNNGMAERLDNLSTQEYSLNESGRSFSSDLTLALRDIQLSNSVLTKLSFFVPIMSLLLSLVLVLELGNLLGGEFFFMVSKI